MAKIHFQSGRIIEVNNAEFSQDSVFWTVYASREGFPLAEIDSISVKNGTAKKIGSKSAAGGRLELEILGSLKALC